jgi:hypothetical protein
VYNVIEELYSTLCPDQPLPATQFEHELDRRSVVIRAVVERIMQAYPCTNAPTAGLNLKPADEFFRAYSFPVGEGSQMQWAIRLNPEWWLRPGEINVVGDEVTLEESMAAWFSQQGSGSFKKLAEKQQIFLREQMVNPSCVVWATVGHELGHLQLGHCFRHNRLERIALGGGIAVGAVVWVGYLAGLYTLYPFLLDNHPYLIFTGGAVALTIIIRLANLLIHRALQRRKEWEAESFAAQHPEAARGGLWNAGGGRIGRPVSMRGEPPALKRYLQEAVEIVLGHHPTFRQRRTFFEHALATLHGDTRFSDQGPEDVELALLGAHLKGL